MTELVRTATCIVEGLLWAGSVRSLDLCTLLDLQEQGLRRVISVLPIGNRPCDQSAEFIRQLLARLKLQHRIVVSADDAALPPDYVAHALGDDLAPTLIHCNAGQNRSTALAACWLIHHRIGAGTLLDAARALSCIMEQRARDLGAVPRLWPAMQANVEAFAAWKDAQP
ncbi:hypothetical protein LCGC14_0273270 [marine sediment metagenome]|uniref:Tyrosine specific protein phosphatases domain-containing protein n=2 Tax=root TaxID=1 RepID=A0A9C9NHM5_9HYPH|nr:hypothetical protein [Aurantimonas coralicida]